MKKVSNAVCPQCSGTITVWFDLNVEVRYDVKPDGSLSRAAIVTDTTGESRFGLRCTSCDWSVHGEDDEIDNYDSIISRGAERAEKVQLSLKR